MPLNARNIEAILNGESVSMQQKKIHQLNEPRINILKPFVETPAPFAPEDIYWQSSLAKFNDKVPSTYGAYATKDTGYSIFITNAPIVEIYKLAYAYKFLYGTYVQRLRVCQVRMRMSTEDSLKYSGYTIDGEMLTNSLYTYQLISINPVSMKALQKYMQEDLNRYFNLNAKYEIMTVKALVLRITDPKRLPKANNQESYSSVTEYEFISNNLTAYDLIQRIESSDTFVYSPYIIVDETNNSDIIGKIEIFGKTSDHKVLDKELRKYGLSLTIEDRKSPILTLSNRNQ